MAIRNTGSGDYLIRTAGGFYGLTTLTVCFWLNLVLDKDASGAAFGLRNTGDSSRYLYYFNPSGDGVTYGWEHFGGGNLDLVALTLGAWHFVAISKAGTGSNQTTAYRRAAEDLALASAIGTFDGTLTPDEEVVLSNGFELAGGWFPGKIAALKQWSGALTADELLAESYQYAPRRLADLHSWRPMIAPTAADAALDFSGNGRHLTPNGALTIEDGPPIAWRQGARRIFIPASAGGELIVASALISGHSRMIAAPGVTRSASGRLSLFSDTRGSATVGRLGQALIAARSGLSAEGAATRQAAAAIVARARMLAGIFQQLPPLTIDRRTIAATWKDARVIDGATWIDSSAFALPSVGMAKTGVKLKEFVIGDDSQIERTYTGLPAGVVITKAWLTVKKSEKQADADALISKEITGTVTAAGHITTADTAGGNLAMFFNLSRTETAAAKPGLEYVYDVQVLASDGKIHTLEKGTIVFIRGVTDANS